ncbi:MAG: dihydrodipicolinate synthase family protein [Gammaproteobacteria bacterium]|nr:dihydrodipicolinate synthase family protein [Gammaproteobacteria bacterium]
MPVELPDGVFAAALTPLHPDRSIDHPRFAEHCRWLLANGCDGLAPMGTTGEANSFTVTERMQALDTLVEAGIPAHRLLVGTGCCAVPDTIALTRHAVEHGVGGTLLLPPFYYKNVSDDGLFAAFDQVIQAVGAARLRIYLYHFPQMSGVPIGQELIARLRQAYPDTLAGMKDSSGDFEYMRANLQAFPGFRVFAGTERYLLATLRAGGPGCISATTNVTAPLAGQVFARRGWPDADGLQEQLTALRMTLEAFPPIPALKALAARRTGHADWRTVRPPQVPLAAARLDELVEKLASLAGADTLEGL